MIRLSNYIDGKLIAPGASKYLEHVDPTTGRPDSEVPDSDEADLRRAVEAAKRAFPAWSNTPAAARAAFLRKISERILAHLEKLARAESIDNGKPISLAREVDIPRSAQNFAFFADAATQFASESHAMEGDALNYTLRKPLGVVGCISPWNLPLYLFTWKIAPALAAGNTVVAKPSEVTPGTAFLLSEICIEAGLPAGVLNIVHGLGHKVGVAMSSHPDVAAISFTGSTRTGAEIARTAAPLFKKLSLEMGGKNANVVFADCDFEEAVTTSVRSSFSNQGQICLCGSRILVERPIYERFKTAFLEKARALRQGDPLEPSTEQGAVVSAAHFEKVMAAIELAKKEGGKILLGGNRARVPGRCENGWFVEPTVIEGLGQKCRTNQEEIFGPVVTLTPFDRDDEALEMANATAYGLAATVWTRDLKRAHRFGAELHTGIVWVNCWMLRDLRTPFGGTKNSGVGREGGFEAMRFFTEPKNVCVKF